MTEVIKMGPLTLRFLRDKDATGGSLDMFEFDIPPNAKMPVPHHHENWDETVYGLVGTSTFLIDGQSVDIGPGQTAFIRRGVVHGFDNRTDSVATCLCVLSPGVLGPEYFRGVAALTVNGPPDLVAMAALMRKHGLVPAP